MGPWQLCSYSRIMTAPYIKQTRSLGESAERVRFVVLLRLEGLCRVARDLDARVVFDAWWWIPQYPLARPCGLPAAARRRSTTPGSKWAGLPHRLEGFLPRLQAARQTVLCNTVREFGLMSLSQISSKPSRPRQQRPYLEGQDRHLVTWERSWSFMDYRHLDTSLVARVAGRGEIAGTAATNSQSGIRIVASRGEIPALTVGTWGASLSDMPR